MMALYKDRVGLDGANQELFKGRGQDVWGGGVSIDREEGKKFSTRNYCIFLRQIFTLKP